MKKNIAQKILLLEWPTLVYLIGITAIGLLFATFVTFVIGLFVAFPLTLINILTVWAAISIVFNVLTANFRK